MPNERTGGAVRNIRGDKQQARLPGLRPVGNPSDPSVELMRGIQGSVKTVAAAAKEMTKVVKDLHVLNERTLRFLETGTNSSATAPGKAVVAQAAMTKDEMRSAITEGLQAAMVSSAGRGATPRWAGGGAGPGPHSNAPDQRRLPGGRQVGTPEEAVQGDWQDAWKNPRGYDVGKLRQDIARRAQRTMSERLIQREAMSPMAGAAAPSAMGPTGIMPPSISLGEEAITFTQGSESGGVNLMTGAQAARWASRSRLLANARNAAGGLIQGGSARNAVGAMLPAGALKLAGGVGAAVGLADQALGFAESQRAANAGWQATLGGSNAEGFGERARSQMFEFRNRGGLGSGQASALYSAVAQTGMRGSERTVAQDFAVDNYKRLGMTVEESMDIVRVASQTGQESLVGVAEALKTVTSAARDAGVNARTARKVFTEGYEAIAQSLGSASAATLAGAAATATARMGRGYEDVGVSNLFSSDNLATLAARSGQRYSSLYAQSIQGGQGAVNVAGLAQQQLVERAQLALGSGGMQAAQQYRQENKQGGRDLTRFQLDDLQTQLLQANPNLDPRMAQEMLSSLGLNVDVNQAIPTMARIATGEMDLAAEARESQKSARTYNVGKGERGRDAVFASAQGNRRGVTDMGDVAIRAGGSRGDALSDETGFFTGKTDRARGLYLSNVRKTGRGSGIIEQALKENFDPNWRFKVVGEGGKDRIVTFDDMMRDYADQAARGDVEIVEGRDKGNTLAGAMQMEVQRDVKVTSDTDKKVAKRDRGKSAEDWEREQNKKGGGRVVIAPTPALSRFFSFMPEGGAEVDLGPAAGNANPRSLPTGNPKP